MSVSTSRLRVETVLTPPEREAIECLAQTHKGIASLPRWADLLQAQFGLSLTLDPDIVEGFVADSSNLPGRADAVCRPSDERECAIISSACFQAGIPFTVSAGRSNLTGSATPEGGVVVAIAGMLTPAVDVDTDRKAVHAPAGVIFEDMRKTVIEQSGGKLIFPVDPTSREDAAVGGALACNASGFTPGEAGAMRDWVESVDFLLPNGKKVSARRGQYVSEKGEFTLEFSSGIRHPASGIPVPRYPRVPIKNAGGPFSSEDGVMDFVDFVIGSEGIFGTITACELRLEERPLDYMDLFFSLAEEDNAVALREYLETRLNGKLGRLSALEYFGVNCRRYMDHEEQLFRGKDAVAVYIQVPVRDGSAEDTAIEWLQILVEADCGVDEDAVMLLDSDRTRSIFMEARHSLPANSLEVVQHRGTYCIMTDALVPPSRFREFLDYANGSIAGEGMDYLSFGHLGDCHLHFMILPTAEQLERGTELYDEIIAKAAELGGVYSGEHGTGKRKRKDFLRCHGEKGVEAVRRAKQSVDPAFLLNRGNVIAFE